MGRALIGACDSSGNGQCVLKRRFRSSGGEGWLAASEMERKCGSPWVVTSPRASDWRDTPGVADMQGSRLNGHTEVLK